MTPFWHLSEEEPFEVAEHTFTSGKELYVKSDHLFIFLCLEGRAEVEVDLWPYTLEPGTQLALLPNAVLQLLHATPDCRIRCVGCLGELFRELSNCLEPPFFRFIKEHPCVKLNDTEQDLLRHALCLMEDVYNDRENPYRRQMAANHIQNLLFHFYRRTRQFFPQTDNKWVNRKEMLFKQFLQLVLRYCSTEREVTFYAQALNITPRYLSNIVLTVGGESTKSIIDRHAIMEIKHQLKNSKLNIQEISNRMHFADQSFFGRYFKKHTGLSPSRYRNEY
ncbi:MAG: AraC family transcriptional regulator [Parabacteroides sp.]